MKRIIALFLFPILYSIYVLKTSCSVQLLSQQIQATYPNDHDNDGIYDEDDLDDDNDGIPDLVECNGIDPLTDAMMKLYTQDGKMIQQDMLHTTQNLITLPETKGIYYLKILTDKGEMNKSIIKK